MKGRNLVSGLLLAAGSAAAAVAFRRRSSRRRARIELYLADGSLISLVEGQPHTDRLLSHARELLTASRT
jgi:hypothetical protein